MKKDPRFWPNRPAFTIVELLVVIVIIVVLASLTFTMVTKMKKQGDGAKSVQNMRQIGALLVSYSVDNSSRLPAPRSDVSNGKGGFSQLHWFEAIMPQIYPDLDITKMTNEWWISNKPLIRNPLCNATTKPYAWANWNPGYAMNRQIAENLGKSSGDWGAGKNGGQTYQIPLNMIPDPSRTPIIAPRGDWHFTYDTNEIKEAGLKPFLINGKMPILFVDGHVETIPLKDYTTRRLSNVPTKTF